MNKKRAKQQKKREAPPEIKIEGLDVPIARDINKFESELERIREDRKEFQSGQAHLSEQKKAWRKIMDGPNKFNKKSMEKSIDTMVVGIRKFSDRIGAINKREAELKKILTTLRMQQAKYSETIIMEAIPDVKK